MAELYTIDVYRLPVRLVTLAGSSFEGKLFLRSEGEHHLGPETVRERLNDPEATFLPCEIGERVELVRLTGLAYVEHWGPLPEVEAEEEMGAERPSVEMLLDSGEVLAGTLVYILPPERHRVLDHLNSPNLRFFVLRRGEATLYINRQAVLRVRG